MEELHAEAGERGEQENARQHGCGERAHTSMHMTRFAHNSLNKKVRPRQGSNELWWAVTCKKLREAPRLRGSEGTRSL